MPRMHVGRLAARPLHTSTGMAAVAFDLEAQIENLRGLKSDLEEHYWAAGAAMADRTRYGIGVTLGQLAQRIAALEDVHRHLLGEIVQVNRLTLDEQHAVERALGVLDGELVLDPEGDENRTWARLRSVLTAADDLLIASARGTAAPAQEAPEDARRAVIVPLRQAR